MKVIIDPTWNLVDAINAAYSAYVGRGLQSTHYKMIVLMAWGNVVGRSRAVSDLEALYQQFGTKKGLAAALGISPKSLRKVDRRFRELPNHSVLAPGAPTQAQLETLHYDARLGGGAYGEVWKAKDVFGRTVAVKFMHPTARSQEDALKHAEALALADGHPNIVKVHYCRLLPHPVEGVRHVGVVMDLIEGQRLDRRMTRTMSADSVQKVGAGVADAISYIHARGLVHGDLHAGNIMVLSDSTPVVIDLLNVRGMSAFTSGVMTRATGADVEDLKGILIELLGHIWYGDEIAALRDSPAWQEAVEAVRVRHIFDRALLKDQPRGSTPALQFLDTWWEVEGAIRDISDIGMPAPVSLRIDLLLRKGLIDHDLAGRLQKLRGIRNEFVHGRSGLVDQGVVDQLLKVRSRLERALRQ